jgi:hypothetical protein
MYLETNVADVMAHILPAFEAVVRGILLLIATSSCNVILHVPGPMRESLMPDELSKMIIGDDDIDVARWKELSSGDYASDTVVMWFWEHMETCSAAERLRVLQWTTGYHRLPYHTSDRYLSNAVFIYFSSCHEFCMYNIRRDRDPAHADSYLPSTATCDDLGQLVLPT